MNGAESESDGICPFCGKRYLAEFDGKDFEYCPNCNTEKKRLEAENKEQKALIDKLCSQEPCPKCGYGVTGACYGCEIKRLKKIINCAGGSPPPGNLQFTDILLPL